MPSSKTFLCCCNNVNHRLHTYVDENVSATLVIQLQPREGGRLEELSFNLDFDRALDLAQWLVDYAKEIRDAS